MHLFDMISGDETPNMPTAPNVARPLRLQIEHAWRGIGESGRSP
jgi:hypothetical protein